MPAPLTQQIVPPFDCTGFPTISGAQLNQLVAGAKVASDKGMVLTTTDVSFTPQVPDATTNTEWQNFIWRRVIPSLNIVGLYIWNPTGAYDGTLLYWQNVLNQSAIPTNIYGILQQVYTSDTSKITALSNVLSTSVQLAPLSTDGTALPGLNTTITPISATSIVDLKGRLYFGLPHTQANHDLVVAIYLNGSGSAVATGVKTGGYETNNGLSMVPVDIKYRYKPNTVVSQVFTFRFMQGTDSLSGGNIDYNGSINGSIVTVFGNTCPSFVEITELGVFS